MIDTSDNLECQENEEVLEHKHLRLEVCRTYSIILTRPFLHEI